MCHYAECRYAGCRGAIEEIDSGPVDGDGHDVEQGGGGVAVELGPML